MNSNSLDASRVRVACTTLLAVCAALVVLVAMPGTASARELDATPASLGGVFAAAQGGDTILLAPGNYGTFDGAMKSGEVILRPKGGAAVTMRLDFNPASNITLDGLTLTEIEIRGGATKNITVRNSDIPGQTSLFTGELQNSNILFDRNVHRDWNKTDGAGEGRIWLPENTNQPSGITIQNSEFRGGLSDGIENGSNGTRIINNTFHDLIMGSPEGVHTDAIALWGSKNTIIRGNYMYRVPAGIMASSGGDHEVIEDNVIDPGEYPYAIILWSDDGSIIRHNTLPDGECAFSARCGIISLGQKSSCLYPDNCDPGHGTVIEDNVLGEISYGEGIAKVAGQTGNLLRDGTLRGSDIRGLPTYTSPGSWAGFALAPGSLGRNNASDGLDRGIRRNGGPPSSSASARVRVLSTLRSIRRTGRLRLRITTTKQGRIRVSGFVRPGRALAGQGAGHSRKLLRLRGKSLGRRGAGTRTATIRLSLKARRTLGRSRNARLEAVVKVDSTVTKSTLKIKR